MASMNLQAIKVELSKLDKEYQEKRSEVLASARKRLDDIRAERDALDAEEASVREMFGEAGGKSERRARKASGPRVGSDAKREVVARLIQEGHIKPGSEMSRGLRSVLKDEGFKAPDFSNLQRLFPEGWSVEKNGQRGPMAKTIFRKK